MTDIYADVCIICLKRECYLLNLGNELKYSENILYKLKNCVPEVGWEEFFKICNLCTENLNKAYDFKQLCIKSYSSWKSILSANIKESCGEKNESVSENESIILENDICSDEEKLITENTCVECYHCSRTFKNKTLLEKHIKHSHKSSRKKNVSKSKTELSEGLNTSVDIKQISELDAKVSPACSLCGTTFCNKYLLKRHLQNVHATEKKFKCDMCERTFVSSVYLNAHKRYHAGDRSHICSFCGKGFITASDLYHHEKIHANKRAYRCEICPKAFNTSSDLHKHKICVHLDRSKWKYVCTYCQRRFPLKTNLDTHVKTHTGEKNYACHLCDRRCINKSVLMRHIETHSNVIAFKCNLCMQGYKYRKSLDVHMAKVHGIGTVKIPEKVKKFFCHLCPKSYFANNKLQKHIRSHSGERPFRCPHCEKTFVDKSYIKQHLKTVHDIIKVEDF